MEKIILIAIVLALGIGCTNTQSTDNTATSTEKTASTELEQATIKVIGMTCEGCEKGVCAKINELDGISEVSASHKDSVCNVSFDNTITTVDDIEKVIAEIGYEVVE